MLFKETLQSLGKQLHQCKVEAPITNKIRDFAYVHDEY